MRFGFAPILREADAGLGQPLVDNDDPNYRALGTAPRDLLSTTHRRAQNLSVALYRGNPIANRAIKIYTSFIAGRGTSISYRNPEVEAVLTEFWDAPRNRLAVNHRHYARDYLLFGEGIHPLNVDEAGNTTIGFIDPTTVPTIYRSPTNNMQLIGCDVERGAAGQTLRLEAVTLDPDPSSPTAGMYRGDVLIWLYDRIAAATRGTPLLLPTLDWIDAYDQSLWEMLERLKAIRAYFWHAKVTGGTQAVQEAQALLGNQPPKSGSMRITTDAVDITAESPQLGASEDVTAARYQLRHIATGTGLAPHWLSEPEDANRSTAEQMDLPVYRGIADTQDEWATNMDEVFRFVLDQKIAAGRLAPVLPEVREDGTQGDLAPVADLYTIQLPELEADRLEAVAAVLAQTASAMLTLQAAGGVGTATIRMVVRHLLPQLGIPADEIPEDDNTLTQALESMWRPRRGDTVDEDLAVYDTLTEAVAAALET